MLKKVQQQLSVTVESGPDLEWDAAREDMKEYEMIRNLVPWTERLPRPFARLENEFADLMGRMWPQEVGEFRADFEPRMNVSETNEAFEVTVDLPGLKPEDFTVEMKNGALWLYGHKNEEHEEKGKTFHRIERRYGGFQRILPLPGVVAEDKVVARYENGVLLVTVPKMEEAKPKVVPISVK